MAHAMSGRCNAQCSREAGAWPGTTLLCMCALLLPSRCIPCPPDAGRHRAGSQRAQLHQEQPQVQAAAAAQHLLHSHIVSATPNAPQAHLHLGDWGVAVAKH